MARSLTHLGIVPTILEIDPVIHEYAQRFFDLPKQPAPEGFTTTYMLDPLTPQTHFGDARAYIEKRSSLVAPGYMSVKNHMRYDYVVHDVFSGGMVPAHLFTKEFWFTVKTLLKEDGIVAVVSRLRVVTFSWYLCCLRSSELRRLHPLKGRSSDFDHPRRLLHQVPDLP